MAGKRVSGWGVAGLWVALLILVSQGCTFQVCPTYHSAYRNQTRQAILKNKQAHRNGYSIVKAR
jgi:hypothetical protein